MNYQQSLKYLNSFINYEKVVPKSHAQFNLERMRYGLDALKHPEHNFFPILIAGTVGKGSTGYFLEQILLQSKISCGFYHSPHIDTIRERIRVGGEMLSENEWAKAVSEIYKVIQVKPFPKKMGEPTFFEMLTLLAILIFSKRGLRVGIFEIGMGGRLDATNILEAPLCVITKIDLDHQAFLGNTIAKIAREKAGIIKRARFTVLALQAEAAAKKIRQIAAKQKSRLIIAKPATFQPALQGEFQKQNAGNASAAARILKEQFDFSIAEKNIRSGLAQKKWAGRIETVAWQGRKLIMDAAHNPAGCRELVSTIQKMKQKPKVLFFSALRDKDSVAMLDALSVLKLPVIVSAVDHPRAKKLADLAAEAEAFFDRITPAKNTQQALSLLKQSLRKGESAVITGSFYLLSEVRQLFK